MREGRTGMDDSEWGRLWWRGGAWNKPAYLSRDTMRYHNEPIYMKTVVSSLVLITKTLSAMSTKLTRT